MSTIRQRYTTLGLALLAVVPGGSIVAQGRVIERHGVTEPEGRLLAFYSATMAFTPAGLTAAGSHALGIEFSYVPFLSAAQRRPSIDKPEATNLAPLFPRPRLGLRFGNVFIEASWIPPVRVFDAEANLISASIAAAGWTAGPWHIEPRVWVTTGRVRGAITCAASAMLGRGSALETYYSAVCHGRESDDWFEPRMLGVEAVVGRQVSAAVSAYAGAGGRLDRSRFDIGVLMDDGSRDPDHPILALRTVRPHATLGAAWRATSRFDAGAELFYAPGSVLTARATVRWSTGR